MEQSAGKGQDQIIDLSELESIISLLPDGPIDIEPNGGASVFCC